MVPSLGKVEVVANNAVAGCEISANLNKLQDITGLHLTVLIQSRKNVVEEWQPIWGPIKSHDFVSSHVEHNF